MEQESSHVSIINSNKKFLGKLSHLVEISHRVGRIKPIEIPEPCLKQDLKNQDFQQNLSEELNGASLLAKLMRSLTKIQVPQSSQCHETVGKCLSDQSSPFH